MASVSPKYPAIKYGPFGPDGKLGWLTQEKIRVQGKGFDFTVPREYFTDLASIPRPAWPILSRIGLHICPSIVHDYGYDETTPIQVNKQGEEMTREMGDDLFYELMEYCEVPGWKRFVMWRCVRRVGWFAWGKS